MGAGLDVRCHRLEEIPFPAKILHELAGQFDGIPFDTIDAGHTEMLNARQQMMQSVPELMEQCDDFIMREECRALLAIAFANRGCEIAVKVCNRRLDAGCNPAPRNGIVHPRANSL